ncbi:zinc metallochaperone AztD [Mycobacterium sp. 236(2023)]|uniref:zinc metallochaperone AztD n=1 Tax=Mycobacterium sp. 236(2023) TaxID=3038163 RepID=UPI002414E333|nr:zinc metallochaperone AztD [Mycobacterium sp. 236(2023)]MDG4665322.1 zinc metallochaperone AztD [Mycobacterium sp. 236(2023)]
MSNPRWLYRVGAVSFAAAALTACGSGGDSTGSSENLGTLETQPQATPIIEPLVATYDGGLYVLDGETLEVKQDIPLDGFLRVNPAGDDAHVLVTTDEGFRVLDASGAVLTDDTFPAAEAGHVVPHGENTVLFADGTGEITAFDPHALADGMPDTQKFTTPQPHHGVAVILADGTLVHSLGDPEGRTGAVALQGDREIARSEDCPGLHGETVVADEEVVLGCENGALIYANGTFTKVTSPTPYGRIGNIKGHEDSPVALGDMKIEPDAELERPEQFSLIDTTTDQLKVVKLPPSVSYSFRSLARGPQAEALMLGTDGKLYVFDPVTGAQMKTVDVTGPWTEPDDWQDPRPTVFTREGAVYVTDPAAKQIHLVDLQSGAITASATLDQTPNELSGAVGHDH